jgi:hypothetical protein
MTPSSIAFKEKDVRFHLRTDHRFGFLQYNIALTLAQNLVELHKRMSVPKLLFSGLLEAPAFPGEKAHLCSLAVQGSGHNVVEIKYYLSTPYGRFPRGIWRQRLSRWTSRVFRHQKQEPLWAKVERGEGNV